jgi:hypothetical protein
MQLDHFVINIDNEARILTKLKQDIEPLGFPFKLSWGVILFIVLVVFSSISNATDWKSWEGLIGHWEGVGGGEPGQGIGYFDFKMDETNNVLHRINHAEYPAQDGKPSKTHDDFMKIYEDKSGFRGLYFDSEGHVFYYSIQIQENQWVFVSDIVTGAERYRLTYKKSDKKSVTIIFEVAPPNQPNAFKTYIEARAVRK